MDTATAEVYDSPLIRRSGEGDTMPSKFYENNTRAATLSGQQVIELREKYALGRTQGSLAREYGVTVGTVGRIVRGETWQHLLDGGLPPMSPGQIETGYAQAGQRPPVMTEVEAAASAQRVLDALAKDGLSGAGEPALSGQPEVPLDHPAPNILDKLKSDIEKTPEAQLTKLTTKNPYF